MESSLIRKLNVLLERHHELSCLLSDAENVRDQERYRKLSKEYADLEPLVTAYQRYQVNEQAVASAKQLLDEKDPEVRALAEAELETLLAEKPDLEIALKFLLLPKDPNDERNIFLEIRAGAGGNEASIFVGDCLYSSKNAVITSASFSA